MTTRTTSRWARATVAIAALVPLTIATAVGAASATDVPESAPVPVIEIIEEAPAVEAPAAEAQTVEAPAAAAPEPEGLASTNDPQDPVETPPTTTATFPEPTGQTWNGWRSGPLEITLAAVVAKPATIGEIVWKLEGAQSETGSDNALLTTVTISAEGTTTLTYFAVDSLDRTSEEKSIEFKIDSTAPSMQVVSPLADGVYYAGDSVLIDLDYGDPHLRTAYFEFRDTGEFVITGNEVVLTEGVHPVRAYALDEAGNETIVDYEITVLPVAGPDTAPPVITAPTSSPLPASGWWNTAVGVTFTATDESAIASFEYRRAVDGGGWGAWSNLTNIPTSATQVTQGWQFFGSGSYVFQLRAADALGNASEPIEFLFQVDKEVGGATVSGFPVNFAVGEAYDLYYTCADALSGVASCTSSNGPSGTPLPTDVEGEHSFTLTNTDVAGNSKTTTWNYTVGEDTTAPVASVTSTATGWVSSGSVDVTFSATDNDGVARLWVQAQGADPLTGQFVDGSSFTFAVTAEGETTLETYAVDAAGNESQRATHVVRIDRTAPTVTITAPANHVAGLVASTSFVLGAVVDLEFECADAGSGVASCEATDGATTLPTTAVGDHSIDVVATDNAGNTTTRTLEYTVTATPADPVKPGAKPTPVVSGLASTGIEIWGLLLFVAALMAAGASFLALSRVRR